MHRLEESQHGESVGTTAEKNGAQQGRSQDLPISQTLNKDSLIRLAAIKLPTIGETFDGTPGTMIPKIHSLAMEIAVLHTNKLGWDNSGKRTPSFPHGGEERNLLTKQVHHQMNKHNQHKMRC